MKTIETYADYHAELPNRSPQWRAERVEQILHQQGRRWHADHDDETTIHAARFKAALLTLEAQELTSFELQRVLYHRFRAVTLAYAISASDVRIVVEARILARQTNEEIISGTGGTPEVIELYEQLFFNVRDRLMNKDYIHTVVIGQTAQSGLEQLTYEQKMKLVAYQGGAALLEQFLHGSPVLPSDDDTGAYLDHAIQNNLRIQAFLTTRAMQPSKFDVRDVINTNLSYIQSNQRESASNQQSEWIGEFVNIVRKRTPIPRGSAADAIPADSPLRNYSVGFVELRAAEQLRAASEGGLPYIDALRNFRLRSPGEEE